MPGSSACRRRLRVRMSCRSGALAGGRPPGERAAVGGDDTDSPHTAWAAEADAVVTDALVGFEMLYSDSHALGVALVRAGAMSAAARLAQRFADARGPREREDRAARAVSCIGALPRASELLSPEVSARAGPPCCRARPTVCGGSPSMRFGCGCGAVRGPHRVARRPACALAYAGAAWAGRSRGRSGVRRGALGATHERGGPAGGHGGACGVL